MAVFGANGKWRERERESKGVINNEVRVLKNGWKKWGESKEIYRESKEREKL